MPVAAMVLFLLTVPAAHARINVVTLPGRDTVQLTIYNSADLTMVRETRTLTFRKGLNRLEFSWANTLIDPTSVELRAVTQADKVEVLDVSFPPRVTNTLEWRIQSEAAGEVRIEIQYFTSGISWSADYVVESARDEKLAELAGYVKVTNNSGEDYENTEVRLVVGVVHLVEEIAQLARQGRPGAMPPAPTAASARESREMLRKAEMALGAAADAAGAKPRQIVKEGVSEYFLYSVEGRDTIPNGWAKRLPSFRTADVPIVSYYKYEKEQWGDGVIRFYRFKNDKPSKLGNEPLPDGVVNAFRWITPDKLHAYVGRTSVKYIPIGEQVELNLGPDQEVLVKPKLMNWEKVDLRFDKDGTVIGWTTREQWEFELQNSRDIDIVLDLRRNFRGDWELKSEFAHENVDATKVKFVVPLKPREKQKLSYELVTRCGSNATR